MPILRRSFFLALLLATALSGCGGGGSTSSSASGTNTPPANSNTGGSGNPGPTQGVWQGTYASTYDMRLIVLDSGETFGLYLGGSALMGALYGDMTASGNAIGGFLSDLVFSSKSSSRANIAGSVVAQKSILGYRNNTQRIDLSYMNSQGVSLSTVAGTYVGRGQTNLAQHQAMQVNVSSSGQLTLPDDVCSASGTISPRNDVDAFTLNLTITGDNCGRRGTRMTGVAHYDANLRRLYVVGLNDGRSDVVYFMGVKN